MISIFLFYEDKNKFEVIKQGRCPTEIGNKTRCEEVAKQLYPDGEYMEYMKLWIGERKAVRTIQDDKLPPGCIRTVFHYNYLTLSITGPLFFWNEARSNVACGRVQFGCLDTKLSFIVNVQNNKDRCRSEADCVCEGSSDPGKYNTKRTDY